MGCSVSKQEVKQKIKYPYLSDPQPEIMSQVVIKKQLFPSQSSAAHKLQPGPSNAIADAEKKSEKRQKEVIIYRQPVKPAADTIKQPILREKEAIAQLEPPKIIADTEKQPVKRDNGVFVQPVEKQNVKSSKVAVLQPPGSDPNPLALSHSIPPETVISLKKQSSLNQSELQKIEKKFSRAVAKDYKRPDNDEVEGTQFQAYKAVPVPWIRGITKSALPDFQPSSKKSNFLRSQMKRGQIQISLFKSSSKLLTSRVNISVD